MWKAKKAFQKEQVRLMDTLVCEPCLKSDIWKFMECETLKKSTRNSEKFIKENKNKFFDFSIIENDNIRDEIKFFFAKQIVQDKKVFKIDVEYSEWKRIISYLSDPKFTCAKSLLDYGRDELIEDYVETLSNINQSVVRVKNKINKNIEKKGYLCEASVIGSLKKIYDFLYLETVEKTKGYFERDKWVFTELPFEINILDCSANKSISFFKIKQPGIKKMVKKLCWYELKMRAAGTAIVRVYSLSCFTKYLKKNYEKVNDIEDVTYDILQNYIAYLKVESGLASKTIKGRIEAVDILLETIRIMKWASIDQDARIRKSDVVKTTNRVGEPYTNDEIMEINRHLDQLPIQIARMILVIQKIGCRVSEACSMKIEDLKISEDGRHYLHYKQFKTNKYNIVPLNGVVLDLLLAAIDTSREFYDDKAEYLFSLKDMRIIKPYLIDQKLKKLSYDWKLKDRSGNLFNITMHRFRDTFATSHAEIGTPPEVIARLLGQKGVGVLKHYVAIQNDIYLEAMQPILEKQSNMIKNIGHIEALSESERDNQVRIALPNGICSKPISSGLCLHANCCYNCKMFVADPKYLKVYNFHLSMARQNIDIARINGFERVMQINQELEMSLLKIINKIGE